MRPKVPLIVDNEFAVLWWFGLTPNPKLVDGLFVLGGQLAKGSKSLNALLLEEFCSSLAFNRICTLPGALAGGHSMSTAAHVVEAAWLGVDERDWNDGVATEVGCGTATNDWLVRVVELRGSEGVALFFVVGPQSSSHDGPDLVDGFWVGLLAGSEWSPLVNGGDTRTSGVPVSVTVTPRFSSIFLQEEKMLNMRYL